MPSLRKPGETRNKALRRIEGKHHDKKVRPARTNAKQEALRIVWFKEAESTDELIDFLAGNINTR
jgi:hypothetical protein